MKIRSKLIMLNINVPVKVGQVTADAEVLIHIFEQKDGSLGRDVDVTDFNNVTYLGASVGGYQAYQKLREHHTEFGVDLNDLLDKEVLKILTDKVVDQIVRENTRLGQG